jgi:hypothetical protein
MRKGRLILTTGALAAGLLGGIAALHSPRADSVQFHLDQLARIAHQGIPEAPRGFKDYLRRKTFLWYLRGRPTFSAELNRYGNERNVHVRALVRLGYFAERDFSFSREQSMDPHFPIELVSALSSNRLACDYFGMELQPHGLRVTACKADLPKFERLLHELDRRESK